MHVAQKLVLDIELAVMSLFRSRLKGTQTPDPSQASRRARARGCPSLGRANPTLLSGR